ncbi:MAG: FtsK/SpoIIIE domain-containing protein [Nitriliruptoraceae bacterium]
MAFLRKGEAGAGGHMREILLRIAVNGSSSNDVAVAFTDDHTVGDVARAINRYFGASAADDRPVRLFCDRIGLPLAADTPMPASELVSGDVVEVVEHDPPNVAKAATQTACGLVCDVVSGAGTGRSLPLEPGRYVVGRDLRADVSLADPTVSSFHAIVTISSSGAATIEPAGRVTNPVVVNGATIDRVVPLHEGAVVQLGGCTLAIRHVRFATSTIRDQLGCLPLNRTPYRRPRLEAVDVPGPGRPPTRPAKRSFNLLALLLPMAGAVLFALVLGRPEFLLFALLGPLSAVANIIGERRSGGRTYRQELAIFGQRRAAWIERLDAAITDERRRRNEAAPDITDLTRRAEARSSDLWARTRSSGDFLHLRLGLGTDECRTSTRLADATDGDTLAADLVEDLRQRSMLTSVPVVVDAVQHPIVSLYGDASTVDAVTLALLVQSATLHSPEDLVICAAMPETDRIVDVVKWLPHTRSTASPIAGPHVVRGSAAANDLVRRLLDVATQRSSSSWPRLLLLLDEGAEVDRPTLSALLDVAGDVALAVMWVGRDLGWVPRQSTAVVHCPPAASGQRAWLWFTDPDLDARQLDLDLVDSGVASRIGRALAPVRDASGASTTNAIPRTAALLGTLGTTAASPEWIIEQWRSVDGYELRAPIGIGPHGPVEIDLVEHGPHALIAGTSGSGKSELLRAIIAALIARHPPSRLNLLFIDYKGGASSNVFQQAPHTVGYVTNLSAELAMRALVSLRAELDRRMRLMEGKATDLNDMLDRFPDEAPPSLVIVVDEFATLVTQVPHFIAGMVDIAQRGRSLGIHLILATQRPSGAVNDDILANTNLRISLRVLDPSDSSSILGGPEAAKIPAPLRGRGFARLGEGGLIEFQSAFPGAASTVASAVAEVTVEDFAPSGPATSLPEPAGKAGIEHSQLDEVIAAVGAASRQLGVANGRRPWVAPLPFLITFDEVVGGGFGAVDELKPGRDVLIGVADLPDHQRQAPEVVDLEATGGLLVFGTGGSGRTTTLRTVIASALAHASPEDVEVFILDYAGQSLATVGDLAHVAAVAAGDDLESSTRILMHLRAEVSRRQTLLAAYKAETLTALHRLAPNKQVPRLLLVVDGYEGFSRTFDRGLHQWSELFVETVLAGRSVGIHLVASVDRRMSIPATIINAVTGRLMLKMADADALMDLGVPFQVARHAQLGDGRALRHDGTTVQVAVVGSDVSKAGQSAALALLAQASAQGQQVRLAELPHEVAVGSLPPSDDKAFTLGVADLTFEPVRCDVSTHDFAVIGPAGSGRSTTLATAAQGLVAAGRDVWVLTAPTSPLAVVAASQVAVNQRDYAPMLDALVTAMDSDDVESGLSTPVLVIDAPDHVGDAVGAQLERLLHEGRVRILAALPDEILSGFVTGWMAMMKRARRMLLLQPDALDDIGLVAPAGVRLRPGQQFPSGRGVFISDRNWWLMQVAR